MKGYRLHLIRHGLTEGNLQGLYLGSGTDSPLCQQGIDNLKTLCEEFSYPWIEKLYVSPMTRTLQTADIIYPEMNYEIVEGMRECNFGEFEGRSFQELMTMDANFTKWLDPKEKYRPLGGESNEEFAGRVIMAINDILKDMMTNGIHEAAVVTHGGVIAMLMIMIAFPRKPAYEWNTDNGCGFTIQTTPEMWMRDGAVEATQIIPVGYDGSQHDTYKFDNIE